ncbi:MAG: Na+/H+ antiporter NhaC family protein [Alphaproteobacteria bacterium]|nr:Na+/H+ antiporter NhaC family protein [Alphaproteobacteria bacterium]
MALITKEVYSSLFTGIIIGALFYSDGNIEFALNSFLFQQDGGMISKISDRANIGIIIFLITLGIIVSAINTVGGSTAFSKWASKHIKSKLGAELATFVLALLLFIDDYFACLTTGSVMSPLTDKHKSCHAKLAYIIDATCAPICIIVPISSWAAAVVASVPHDTGINGFSLFLSSIPYNLYAILTLFMTVFLIFMQKDFSEMKKVQEASNVTINTTNEQFTAKGDVIDLICPVLALILFCFLSLMYTGGFFEESSFKEALTKADSSKSLVLGSFLTLIFSFIFYISRNVISFKEFMNCVPSGFKAMTAPLLILTLAWTISGITNLLGAKFYVENIVANSASSIQIFLPTIIFIISAFLSFSIGTSWGTFSLLIPIICSLFSPTDILLTINISACLAGSVFGDHCSPISDTTIMSAAGAKCDFIEHVSTQLPYASLIASLSVFGYILLGFLAVNFNKNLSLLVLPFCIILLYLILKFLFKHCSK